MRPQNPAKPGRPGEPNEPDRAQGESDYPQIPEEQPGLVGGPTTEAVPGKRSMPGDLLDERKRDLVNPQPGQEDDGGESILSGRPHGTGGQRPQ